MQTSFLIFCQYYQLSIINYFYMSPVKSSPKTLKKSASFPQASETTTLDVSGMKCAGCVNSVERQLCQHEGVISASVNLITSVALVEYQPEQVKPENLAQQLTSRGFPSQVRKSENITNAKLQQIAFSKKEQEKQEKTRQLITAAILLLLSSIGHLHHFGFPHIPILMNIWFHWALATLALLIPGREILLDGWRGLWHFSPNMNTLVGLGSVSAYLASCVALIFPELGWECFFDEPVMLLGFIFLGRVLESRARGKASEALEALLNLRPQFARLVGKVNTAEDTGLKIPVEQIRLQEWVKVLPGEKIPVDGEIIKGQSTIDESMLTGESIPVTKEEGDTVSAGTINHSGIIIVETNRIGSSTTLNQIIATVEEAQIHKAPVQKLADTVAGYFAYGVMAIALITFLFWYFIGSEIWSSHLIEMDTNPLLLSLKLAIAVLVIACPCALGLATPTAILVGTGIGAERGLLIKGGDVLEKVNQLGTIVFDKTGTLTQGYPQVTKVISFNQISSNYVLQLAASIERNSNHPLAQAILTEAQRLEIPLLAVDEFQEKPGSGINATVINNQDNLNLSIPVCLGNQNWLQQQGINITEETKSQVESLAQQGQTVVYIAADDHLIGLITLADKLRPDAENTVQSLKKLGLDVILLTGDQHKVAQAIASQLKINTYFAGIYPDQKANFIKTLQKEKKEKLVAMVGDGINDAPALAESDLAIAMPQGAEISVETAEIVLMRNQLLDIVEAIKLSKATLTKIRQNLFWALGYNIIAIPIAAGFLLPFYHIILSPSVAGAFMAFSSVMVVTNSVFLRRHFSLLS